MLSIFTWTMVFFQSTNHDWLKLVMTAGLVNMHIDRSIANLELLIQSEYPTGWIQIRVHTVCKG